ncbi:GntR family transcriptional regulator [Nitratireductor indicus]|uniref:GntR family transcriptional regulator n=1 Tax=Nitratireductor indicus C115 TaxID=1231190 RepID=K2N589_9HYPH|nr:GntR family transcriptional regulator [Nitratireductor indicus]EKF42568.1 GntR family transcriptional regulator [Nitratireductor indicus C115]MDS1138057.1 GntR family transcriptional regulator [Nitratireductor indicus]SFQ57433.1 DNA-binding transcriptional regulator, GntR family [Nitratireductor indicus]
MQEIARLSAASITASLKDEILAGQLLPGQRLGEVALAERFSVSRGPVREALRSLVDAQLATLVPNVGVRVREIGFADAQALYELREGLESEAARLAARRATVGQTEQLRLLLDGHAVSVTAHPAGAYLQSGSDTDFHVVVAALSGNPMILRLLSEELYPQLVLMRRQHQNVQGRGQTALMEHRRIVDAIADRDEEVAALLMRRHIRNSWLSLAPQIENGGETK